MQTWTPEKPETASGPYPRLVDAPKSAAITHALFDRIENMLPRYVGLMPALVISMLVSVALFVLGCSMAKRDYDDSRKSEDPFLRQRWAVFLVTSAVVCYLLQGFLFERIFMYQLVAKNRQHFANLFWIKKYFEAGQ